MASRLKAGGVSKKPKAAKKGGGKGKGGRPSRTNTLTAEEAADAFEELFDLHKELSSVSGEVRKRIADEYATIAKRLEIPKKIVKHEFALEKHRRETAKKEAEFDAQDRDALMKLAQIFGDDTPMGQFASRAAGNAKRDEFGGSKDAGEGADQGEGSDPESDDGED
jgi:hypothetical protein